MVIKDARSEFASNVTVALAAGTTVLGNVYDTAAAGTPNQITNNFDTDELFLRIQVRGAAGAGIFTGGSAGTIQFQFVSSAAAALTSPNIHFQTQALVTGATPGILPGTILFLGQIPKGSGVSPTYLRFVGMLVVVGTTTITSGTVDAFLSLQDGGWAAMPEAPQ